MVDRMNATPTNRKWILSLLNEHRPEAGQISQKGRTRSFSTIVRFVEHDEDVLKLFNYAGLNYRDAGHWYPLMGLLAELVAPDAIPERKKVGRSKSWTDAECKLLLERYDQYKVRFPKSPAETIFVKMQRDQPAWYPLQPNSADHDKSIQAFRKDKAKTLARKRRALIRLGRAGASSEGLK